MYIDAPSPLEKPRFELTALIDIIFILVLFFAVSTSFTQQKKALPLVLPSAVSSKAPPKTMVVSIDQKQRLYWNQSRINASELGSKVQMAIKHNPTTPLLLQAHQQTPYVRVVSVLDTIRLAGGAQVMLETNQP